MTINHNNQRNWRKVVCLSGMMMCPSLHVFKPCSRLIAVIYLFCGGGELISPIVSYRICETKLQQHRAFLIWFIVHSLKQFLLGIVSSCCPFVSFLWRQAELIGRLIYGWWIKMFVFCNNFLFKMLIENMHRHRKNYIIIFEDFFFFWVLLMIYIISFNTLLSILNWFVQN